MNKELFVSVASFFTAFVFAPAFAQEADIPRLSMDEVYQAEQIVDKFVDELGVVWTYEETVTEFAENLPLTEEELAEDEEEDFEDDGSLTILFENGRLYVSEPIDTEPTVDEDDGALLDAAALRQIVPPDNRARPWKWVVYFANTDRRGRNWTCSGAVVGPRLIATAAHCVHTGERSGKWRRLPDRVWVARTGNCSADNCPTGVKRTIARVTPTAWRKGTRKRWPVDRGVIILAPGDRLSSAYSHFGYRDVSARQLRRGRVTTAGYPGNQATGTMWTDTCSTRRVMPRKFFHNCSTVRGQSGSGVWLENTEILVGVVSGFGAVGNNRATRMNGKFVRMINNQRQRFP